MNICRTTASASTRIRLDKGRDQLVALSRGTGGSDAGVGIAIAPLNPEVYEMAGAVASRRDVRVIEGE